MSKAPKEFVENDEGFGQYTDRYEEVSSDMAVRRQLATWYAEMDKLDIVRALGKAEGIAVGKAEEKIETANQLAMGCGSQANDIPLTEVITFIMSELKKFEENDEGFGQYTDRYEEVSSDIAVRRQLAAWSDEMDKLDIVRAR